MFFRNFNRRHVGGFLIFSGGSCFVVASLTFLFARHFVSTAAHVQGKILRMLEQRAHDGESTVYYPVFTFQDARGINHTIHSSWGSFPLAYEVGTRCLFFTIPVILKMQRLTGFSQSGGGRS